MPKVTNDQIKRFTASFDKHQLKVLCNQPHVQMFTFRDPATFVYGFNVTCSDNCIAMTGDLYNLIITPGYGRGLGWLRSAMSESEDGLSGYIYGKIPSEINKTEFDGQDAYDTMKKHIEEYYCDEDSREEQKKLLESLEDHGEFEHIYDFSEWCDSNNICDWYEIYSETTVERIHYQMMALKIFCDALDKINFTVHFDAIENNDQKSVG